MLCDIRISNLAVVEDTVLRFGDGLNVLTGSTGAGKSIILTAVSLLSGRRADKSLIRSGEKELLIEGNFRVSSDWALKGRLGMGVDDEFLSIRRIISKSGTSRIWINGTLSTNSAAREITEDMLELHGQHRQQELLDPETHIDYLDAHGDYDSTVEMCQRKIRTFREVYDKLRRLIEEEEDNRRKKDFIEYQYKELSKLDLRPGLKEDIITRIARGQNMNRFVSALSMSRSILEEREGNIIESLGSVKKELEKISPLDGRWEDAIERIDNMLLEINEISADVNSSLQNDPEEVNNLEILQEKMALIQRAERKYEKSPRELIEYRDYLQSVLKGLEEGSDEIIESKEELGRIRQELIPLLEELSKKRKENAKDIDRRITSQLRELGIQGASFRTRVDKLEIKSLSSDDEDLDLSLKGWDDVEFMIRTNVGEDIRPLRDIVSGGELSRITLVLRSILVEKKGIPTLIFDEVDTGLGADTGERVADKMRELSNSYQIVCITHLAQIAAAARKHFVVEKDVVEDRTISSAHEVGGEDRIIEIARMLGGKRELSLELASEMVDGNCARSSGG